MRVSVQLFFNAKFVLAIFIQAYLIRSSTLLIEVQQRQSEANSMNKAHQVIELEQRGSEGTLTNSNSARV